jgi:DNA-binding protein H-NS
METKNISIKDLSLTTEIEVSNGKKIKVDFTDKRFVNKLLKLIKRYSNIEQEIDEKVAEIEKIEDDLDKLIAYTDMEVEILTEFKDAVDKTFNAPVTTILFGDDTLPTVERYFELFEALLPYAQAAREKENNKIIQLNEKYGFNRINKDSDTNA